MRVVEVVVVGRRPARPATCSRARIVVVSNSGLRRSTPSTPPRASRRRARRRRRRRREMQHVESARARRRARTARDGPRTRRRPRGGRRAGAATTVSHDARVRVSPTGATTQREVLGAVGVGEDVEAGRRRVGARRGARRGTRRPARAARRRRGSAVGVSASTNQTSVVTFDADVITTKRPVRVRSTDDVVPLVVLLEHEHVVGGGRADACGATPATGAWRRRAA